jgi:hypothetical protein
MPHAGTATPAGDVTTPVSGTATPDAGTATRDAVDAGPDSARPESKFVSVTVDFSGDSAHGVLLRTVEAPGLLTLEDETGEEQAQLDPADYQAVLGIVLSPAFLSALQDPNDCHLLADSAVAGSVKAVWTDVGTLADLAAQSCVLQRRDEANHPYSHLYWLLIDLQKKYLPCRTLPAYDPRARPLCAGCWGWFPPDDC